MAATNRDADLGAQLLSVVARLNRWATRHAEAALPAAQARLLAEVEELAPTRIGELARADHSSQPAMTRQIRRLEQAGLVERAPDPADGRAALVSPTAAGRRALVEARVARTAALDAALAQQTPAQVRRLQAASDALTELIDAAGRTPPRRDADEET